MKKLFLIVFLAVVGLVVVPFKDYAADEPEDEIKIYLGQPKVISVSNPTRIAIGNPNIVDVVTATKQELTLSPKTTGTTTLAFWDSYGEQSFKVRVIPEDVTDIKRRIDNLLSKINLPGVYTQVQEDEGKVLLLGRVKTAQEREKVTLALGELKNKTLDLIEIKEEESVVQIEVQVMELNKDATNTLGFTWPGSLTLTEKGSPGISDAGAKLSSGEGLFRVLNINRTAYSLTLDALVQEGKAKILSQPRLACQSGKEAQLLVGGEKPIFTTEVASTGGQGTNVEYKEYGIKLKIKPTVTEEKQIKLALDVDISEAGAAETIGAANAPTAKAYPLTKRTASTELFVGNGQTLAIGGLIKQKTEEDIRKSPFIGDVPVLGWLFTKKTTKWGGGNGERGNTELFITLTPTLIGEEKKTAEVKKESPKTVFVAPQKSVSDPLLEYAGVIQKRILENLTYPSLAKESGFQGALKLSLFLSYRGELLDLKVKESSGYELLDENAINVAKAIGIYPPFPASINLKDVWIDVPILYNLD